MPAATLPAKSMALRLNSLKTRTAVALSLVIVAVLTANALYLILTKRAELRRDIETRGELFASLTAKPICVGYETYYASGFYKFQELIGYYLGLEEDLERVRIINVNGKILFDSAELQEGTGQRQGRDPERWVEGSERLEAIKRLELTSLPARDADGNQMLEVIAPYIEDWGRHRLSVAYTIHFRNLQPSINRLIGTTVGLTILSMFGSVLIAVALSTSRSIPHTHHPDGMSMSVFNNRMHDVLNEMGAHIEATLGKCMHKIECVQASPTKMAHVWAGGVSETRAAALAVMASRNPPRRSQAEPADVVVYGLPAWSPYAVFGQMNPILTLISSGLGYLGGYIEALGKRGCTVVLATPCPDTHHRAGAPARPSSCSGAAAWAVSKAAACSRRT